MKNQAKVIWLNLAFIIIAVLLLTFHGIRKGFDDISLIVRLPNIAFGMVGILFYLMSKYRSLRDTESFDFNRYWFDYLFRAIQATIYIIVVDTLFNGDTSTGTAEAAAASGAAIPQFNMSMAVLSLFIGMFIGRVEKAFESLGDRVGDVLQGIFGAKTAQLSQEDKFAKTAQLKDKLLSQVTLRKNNAVSYEPEVLDRLDSLLVLAKEHLQGGKIDAANATTLEIDFLLEYEKK